MFIVIGNKKTEHNKDMDYKYAICNRLVNRPTKGIFIFGPIYEDPRFLCITYWDYSLEDCPIKEILFQFACP